MAIKSALFEYFWWIPTSELEDEKPTAFLLCQMSKKERDIVLHKNESLSTLAVITQMQGSENVPDRIKAMLESTKVEQGFEAEMYSRCIKEIRNINVLEEGKMYVFKESLTNKEDIVKAVAGLKDAAIGTELDNVLWNSSNLTEFETANFTPSSGYNNVFQTIPVKSPIEALTA